MPLYDFYCPHCLETSEHFFRMEEVPGLVVCKCGATAYRKYNTPNVSCTVSRYSPALGIDTADKGAVRDMQRKYNDATGSHLIEVGNENIRRAPQTVDWDRVANEAKAMEGAGA